MGVELQGIPETTLWTRYMRAAEARRPDSVIDDPRAVDTARSGAEWARGAWGRRTGAAW